VKLARTALTVPVLLAVTACGAATADAGAGTGPTVEVRLPDPGNNGALALAKKDGSLDRALAAVHARVSWSTAPADFGAAARQLDSGALDAAESSIAEGAAALGDRPGLRIFGVAKPDPMGEGVLVKNGSKLRTVKDLAGRRVAVERGSAGEYLLLKALQKNNVPVSRVERVYLDRARAEEAFRVGDVDGWAATGPSVVMALTEANAHLVATGSGIDSDNYRFWAVRGELADRHPEVVKALYHYLHARTRAFQGDPAAFLNVFTDTGPQAIVREERELVIDFGKGAAPVEPATPVDTERLERVAQLLAEQRLTPARVAIRPLVLNVESLPERTK